MVSLSLAEESSSAALVDVAQDARHLPESSFPLVFRQSHWKVLWLVPGLDGGRLATPPRRLPGYCQRGDTPQVRGKYSPVIGCQAAHFKSVGPTPPLGGSACLASANLPTALRRWAKAEGQLPHKVRNGRLKRRARCVRFC